MTTLTNLSNGIKTGIVFVKEMDKDSGKQILVACNGNKPAAIALVVGSYAANVALNFYCAKALKKRGWNRTAKFFSTTTKLGMVTTTPRIGLMVKAIAEA